MTPTPTRPGRTPHDDATARRRSLLWGSLSLGAVLLILAGVLVFDASRGKEKRRLGPPRKRSWETPARLTGLQRPELFPAFTPDGRSLLFSAETETGYEIAIRALSEAGPERLLTSDGQQNIQPSPSPKEGLVAYHSVSRGGIWAVPLAGGAPRQLSATGSAPRFSPDGSLIAFQSGPSPVLEDPSRELPEEATIWVVRPDGTGLRRVTQPGSPPGAHSAPAWLPRGGEIVFLSSAKGKPVIWSVSLSDGRLRKILASSTAISSPIAAPDGSEVLFASAAGPGKGGIFSVPIAPEGRPATLASEVLSLPSSRPRHIAVSPDGSRVAFDTSSTFSHLHAIEITPKDAWPASEPRALTNGEVFDTTPAFSPDGAHLAFSRSEAGGAPDIWVASASGSDPRPLTTSPARDSDPSWFPSGAKILFTSDRSGSVRPLALRIEGEDEKPLKGARGETPAARISPDGNAIAFNVQRLDGTSGVALLDLLDGQTRPLTVPGESAGFPEWSPNGRWLSVQVRLDAGRTGVGLVPVDTTGPHPVRVLTVEKGRCGNGGFSSDGSKVLFTSERDGVWNVFWISTDGDEKSRLQLTRFSRKNRPVRHPRFSPGGKTVIFDVAEPAGSVWITSSSRARVVPGS